VVGELRRFRKAHGLRDTLSLSARIVAAPDRGATLESVRPEIERLAALSSLQIGTEPGEATASARLSAAGAQVLVPLAGVLDPDVERERLARRLAAIAEDRRRAEAKLANASFVERAPSEVVQSERDKLTELSTEADALERQLADLGSG
jgi:valyl-tRNA synthetase